MKSRMLFIYISCALLCSIVLAVGIDDQRNALIDLFNATNGEGWIQNDNWTKNDDYCTWFGVRCAKTTKNVEVIQLVENNLQGTIPESIGIFEDLSSLELQSNRLSGTIPNSIGKLKSLGWLYLNKNMLTGTIPIVLEQMTNIIQIHLFNNQLTGTIPGNIGHEKLLSLDLSYNNLTGAVPISLSLMAEPMDIRLRNNQLTSIEPNITLNTTYLFSCNVRDNPFQCPIARVFVKLCQASCGVKTPVSVEPVSVNQPPIHEPTAINDAPSVKSNSNNSRWNVVLFSILIVAAVIFGAVLTMVVYAAKRCRRLDPERQELLVNQRGVDN